jgi:uncharacterized protein YbaP (TraB family)
MGNKDSLLWSVTKEHIQHEIYGTMHLPFTVVDWPSEKVLDRLKNYTHYFGEMNLDERISMSALSYYLPSNESLNDFLPPKKYQKMRRILIKAFGVDIEKYKSYFPLFIQYQIDFSISAQYPDVPMDQFIWNNAKMFGCNMGGLESKAAQIKILHQLPLKFQLEMIKRISNNVSNYRKTIKKLIKCYEAGKIDLLKKKAVKSMGSYKYLMIYDRNQKMADKIDSLEHNSFITFGAGHLSGNKGIIAILKRKGWKVKAM